MSIPSWSKCWRFVGPLSIALASVVLPSCKTVQNTSAQKELDQTAANQAGGYCVALQGNGRAIFGHFHTLANVVSDHGLVDSVAGSSSSTVTMFLYESMLKNPFVSECTSCSQKEKAERVSLMLKSLVGFFQARLTSPEGTAVTTLLEGLKAEDKSEIIKMLASGGPALPSQETTKKLADRLGILANKQYIKMIASSKFHRDDLLTALKDGPFNFKKGDVLMFARPFPLGFDGIATVVGWVGNFYAGHEGTTSSDWESFYQQCKNESGTQGLREKSWGQLAYSNYDPSDLDVLDNPSALNPTQCQKAFSALMAKYDSFSHNFNPPLDSNDRINDPVGATVDTLVETGLLVGNGAKAMEKLLNTYNGGAMPANRKEVGITNFPEQFRIGFFASEASADRVDQNIQAASPEDIKAHYFSPLRKWTWRTALQTSPAEPSIAPAFPMSKTKDVYSVSGWVEPLPSTLLKHNGCKNIYMIAGEFPDFNFPKFLSSMIGGTLKDSRTSQAYSDLLYGTGTLDTAVGPVKTGNDVALTDADAVVCTDWFKVFGFDLKNIYKLTESSIRAPIELRGASPFNPSGMDQLVNKKGCTPSVQ